MLSLLNRDVKENPLDEKKEDILKLRVLKSQTEGCFLSFSCMFLLRLTHKL